MSKKYTYDNYFEAPFSEEQRLRNIKHALMKEINKITDAILAYASMHPGKSIQSVLGDIEEEVFNTTSKIVGDPDTFEVSNQEYYKAIMSLMKGDPNE